ncbi:hypothetical protein [Desulfosporosinus sp. SB140]|uniref:hypothetical protein n=1 Tax=Desulfosporosinus paludis TaxID=3115649 RepID=UPI00388F9578
MLEGETRGNAGQLNLIWARPRKYIVNVTVLMAIKNIDGKKVAKGTQAGSF